MGTEEITTRVKIITTTKTMAKKKDTYLIAEIAQAHEGSLGILHSFIDALAKTGVNAIKFQTHIAEAESSLKEPFRINFSYEDKTRFDYWQRMSFSAEQWIGIKRHCDEKGVTFLSSPFSQAAVDLLEKLNVEAYKIGSGEICNFLMLEKIARTKKPVLLSSGMSSWSELDQAVQFMEGRSTALSILQCTTSYPTPPERIGLNIIPQLKKRYPKHRIGLSEHTANIATGLAGVALGAEVLEFHATFDRQMFGPDATSSLTISEIKQLVESVRFIDKSLQNPVDKNDLSPYRDLKKIFEKSLAVSRNLPVGHQIRFEDLEAKKPAGQGIPAAQFESVLGKQLKHPKKKYEFLTTEDLIQ